MSSSHSPPRANMDIREGTDHGNGTEITRFSGTSGSGGSNSSPFIEISGTRSIDVPEEAPHPVSPELAQRRASTGSHTSSLGGDANSPPLPIAFVHQGHPFVFYPGTGEVIPQDLDERRSNSPFRGHDIPPHMGTDDRSGPLNSENITQRNSNRQSGISQSYHTTMEEIPDEDRNTNMSPSDHTGSTSVHLNPLIAHLVL